MVRDLPERPPPRLWLEGALLRIALLQRGQKILPALLQRIGVGLKS
jgi:hypothetical protein